MSDEKGLGGLLLRLLLKYILLAMGGCVVVLLLEPLFNDQIPAALFAFIIYLFFLTSGFMIYAHDKLRDWKASLALLLGMFTVIIVIGMIF